LIKIEDSVILRIIANTIVSSAAGSDIIDAALSSKGTELCDLVAILTCKQASHRKF